MFATNTENERGQVGIGTLIVFIAMVLVAAIAAGVLINTAGMLQSQAEATGEESTDLVSERIDVDSAVGLVDSDGDAFEDIRLHVSPAAGADEIDMSDTIVQAVGPTGQANLVYDEDYETGDGESILGDDNGDMVLQFDPASAPFGGVDDPDDVATLSGTVVDDGGDPIENAHVGYGGQHGTTNSDGDFTLRNVEKGEEQEIVIFADDKATASADLEVDEDDYQIDDTDDIADSGDTGAVNNDHIPLEDPATTSEVDVEIDLDDQDVTDATVYLSGVEMEHDGGGVYSADQVHVVDSGDIGIIAEGYEAETVSGDSSDPVEATTSPALAEIGLDIEMFGAGDEATLDIVSPSGATTTVELNAPDLISGGEAVRL